MFKYWNYRVCETLETDHDGSVHPLYGIQEVHYDDTDTPAAFSDADVVNYESVDALKRTLSRMLAACDKPVVAKQEPKEPRRG